MGGEDPLVALFTVIMIAAIRLADAIVAVQRGVTIDDLRPKDLAQLDAEARRIAEEIIAARRGARDETADATADKRR